MCSVSTSGGGGEMPKLMAAQSLNSAVLSLPHSHVSVTAAASAAHQRVDAPERQLFVACSFLLARGLWPISDRARPRPSGKGDAAAQQSNNNG